MLSKETFVKAINAVRDAWDYQEGLNNFFGSHGADGYVFQPDCSDALVSVVEEAMGLEPDENHVTDVSWFCYEMDFGRKFEMGDLTIQGKDVDVSDAEKLYDYLVNGVPDDDEEKTDE